MISDLSPSRARGMWSRVGKTSSRVVVPHDLSAILHRAWPRELQEAHFTEPVILSKDHGCFLSIYIESGLLYTTLSLPNSINATDLMHFGLHKLLRRQPTRVKWLEFYVAERRTQAFGADQDFRGHSTEPEGVSRLKPCLGSCQVDRLG
jgi:hypothetical protein